MAYTTPRVWAVGEGLTAAKLQAVSDNITYLKSQTDMIYVAVYNNDASTLNQFDAIVIDPSYTSGLAVKTSTNVGDMRAFGVVISASISSHSTGIVAFGRLITQINVNGAVVFGHSLIIGANAHYAQDSGGGGTGYGVIGFALAANASGNATIAVLLDPHPLFMTAAQVITQKYGIVDSASSTISNVVNVTPNQCLLFCELWYSGSFSAPLWNSLTPTQIQAASPGSIPYVGILIGAGAATANFTATGTPTAASGYAVALNGINQGTGSLTYGTLANSHSNSAGAMSITVTCVPGDLVLCFVTIAAQSTTGISLSGENQTIVDKQGTSTTAYIELMSAVATSTSVTFNVTTTGSGGTFHASMDGIALHTA